jgi:hypothetical protein
MSTPEGLIVAPVTSPAELMAGASRELAAAWSQFNVAHGPEEISAACSRLRAAEDRVVLIAADSRSGVARVHRAPFRLPWVARGTQGRRALQCAG